MRLPPAFGAELRRARRARGLGLRETARLVGVSGAFLCNIENGRDNGRPSEATVRKLASLLGVNHDHLLALAGRLAADVQAAMVACVLDDPDFANSLRARWHP